MEKDLSRLRGDARKRVEGDAPRLKDQTTTVSLEYPSKPNRIMLSRLMERKYWR